MSKKMGHLVSTRCGCGWNGSGKPNHMDGYGIYSASKDLFEEKCDYDLRDVALQHQHRQDAYTYFVPDKGRPMLVAYRKRTKDDQNAAEKAGVDSRASYISECLVGNFDHYAFEYIDSPFWQSIYRPIADFYANADPMPLEEPLDADAISVSSIDRKDIMAFVADGRTDAVKAAVWAMLRQYDLPAAGRKFLVICDSEANVRKWIAAICYCLPIQAANEISFNTCMEKLNQEPDCCYYIERSTGMYTKARNIQDPNQERRWCYMIAGADPLDRTSNQVANPMPNAPYLTIDGATKQAKFETDQLMLRSYMKNIITNDGAIEDFCCYMNEMQDIHMGSGLCDLYDAQNALTNEAGWSCSVLCRALAQLTPHFTKQSVLMRYAVSRLCVEGQYTARFLGEDENNALSLLRSLHGLVHSFEITEAMSAMQEMLVKRISALLGNNRDVGMLSAYISCLKKMDKNLYLSTINEIVETSKLGMVTDTNVASGSDEYILKLFEVINDYIEGNQQGWAGFFKAPEFARLVEALISRSMQDEKMPGYVLNLLSGDSKAIDNYILRGCQVVGSSNQTMRWWRTMLQNRVVPEYLCELINANGIGTQEIESILCLELRIHGYSENLRSLFNKYLAKVPGAGHAFYRERIQSIAGSRDRIAGLRQILTEMASNTNFTKQLSETLNELDCEITMDQSKEMTGLVELVCEFARRARVQCNNALLWNFLYTMIAAKVSRRDKEVVCGVFLLANAGGYRFVATESLLRSQFGEAFMARMREYDDQSATHIIVLNSFAFTSVNAHQAYVKQYARMICNDTVKKKCNALASVIFLREMVAGGQMTREPGADTLRKLYAPMELMNRLDELLVAIQGELGNLRTDNIEDKVIDAAEKSYGADIATKVELMFDAAQETYKRNNQKQSVFGKILGKLKK